MANVPASYGVAPDVPRETVCEWTGVDKTSKAKHDDRLNSSLHGRDPRAASLPRSHKPGSPASFFSTLFAGLILLALAVVAVIVFRNHEKLYDWPIWLVTAMAFSWLLLAGYAFALIARGMIA